MRRTTLTTLAIAASAAILLGCNHEKPPAPGLPAANTIPPPPQPGRNEPPPAQARTPAQQPPAPPATPPSKSPAPAPPASTGPAASTGPLSHIETDSGLIIEDLVLGSGAEAKKFDHVKVNYIGTFADGREFDNTYKRHEPLTANLAGGVVKGWQEGIPGMKVGGKRRLIVPPELGYGPKGSGQIPPNSMLIFEIELLDVVK